MLLLIGYGSGGETETTVAKHLFPYKLQLIALKF